MARAEHYQCRYECCVWEYDPVELRIIGGIGVAGCKCDAGRGDDAARLHKRI